MTPKEMVESLYQNFPEASQGSALRCVGWKYKDFLFKFVDEETGNEYTVKLPAAIKGFKKLVKIVRNGELPGLGLPADFATSDEGWDGLGIDALAQCAVFGEVIYG